MRRLASPLACLLLLSPAVAAQGTCRPNALGPTTCLGTAEAPPPPRRPGDGARQGLELVIGDPQAREPVPEPLPPRRTNSLGVTLIEEQGNAPDGPCRRDTLGNLRCR
jgi:hypothetical protein